MSSNPVLSIRLEASVFAAASDEARNESRDLNDFIGALIVDGLVARGAFDDDPDEKNKLLSRERLLAVVARTAKEIEARDGHREDITVATCRQLETDKEWLREYREFIEAEPFDKKVPLKKRINPRIGARIAASLGYQARRREGNSGPAKTIPVTNSIIQLATALEPAR